MAKDYKKMLQEAGFGTRNDTEQDEQTKKSGGKNYEEMLRKAGFGVSGNAQRDDGLDDAQRAARARTVAARMSANGSTPTQNKNGLDEAQQAARARTVAIRDPEWQQELQALADKMRMGREFKQSDEYKTGLQNRMSGASLSQSLAQNAPVVAPVKATETTNTAPKTEAREVYNKKQETPYLPGLRDNSVTKQIGYLAEMAAAAVNLGAEDLKGGVKDLFDQITAGIEKVTDTKQVGKVSLPTGIKNSNKPTFGTYSEKQQLGLDESTLIKSMLKASEDAWYLNSDTEETPAEKRIAEIEDKYKYTNKSGVTSFLASALSGTGYGAQNIVGSLVSGGGQGNPVSASMTLFKDIRKNMRDAKRAGYSKDDAVKYAAMQTLADTGLDALLNAVGTGAEQVAGKAIANIPSVYGRAAARTGVSAMSEAAQSALSNIVSVANQKVTGNPDAKIDWNSVARSAAVGGFSGALQQGIIEIVNLPENVRLAKRDYAVAEEYIKRATHVESTEEAGQMVQIGKKLLEYVDDLVNDGTSESKGRAKAWKAYKDTISAVVDDLENYGDRIVVDFTDKSDIVNNLINAPKTDIVEGTAELVNKVAESIEPDENAVNATIDYLRDEIKKKQNEITMQTDPVLRRETEIDRLAIIEIEKTLRNKRAEIENARKKKLAEEAAVEKQAEAKGKTTVKDRSETKKTVSSPVPPVYHEGKGVVQYFTPGRKTPVTTSSKSDLDVLKLFGGNTTIRQAYETPIMSSGSVKKILDAYISRGYGDVTLHDMFGFTGKNEFEANQNTPVRRVDKVGNNIDNTATKNPETNAAAETEKPLTETAPDVTMEQEKAVKPEEQPVQPEETVNPETDVKKTGQFIVDGKVVELDTTKKVPATKDFSLTHVVKKHTKTGEDMDVFQIPKNLSDAEYKALKQKMKDVGGYYSSFVRGFIVPRDKAGSVSDFADVAENTPAPKKVTEAAIESLDKGDKLPDSGVTLAKDADKYTDDHQRVMEEYANAVDKDFLDYLSVEVKNPGIQANPYKVASMSDKTADMIKEKIGLDTTGWDVKIEPRMVDHIWKRHGENGEQDHSMADVSDIARIAYVLNDPDTLDETEKSKAYMENHPYLEGKTRAARSVLITKKVNGTYYVVEAVPNSDRNAAFIVSAYMNKKGVISTTDNSLASPAQTSAGNDVNTLSENQTPATIPDHSDTSIAEKAGNVNTKSPTSEISSYVLGKLSEGKKFTSQELQDAANKAYGGTMAEGKYDVKAMTDAMELGINKYIIDTVSDAQSDFNAPEAKKAVESIDEITNDILSAIPTQTKRSEEQIALQQFSTPPNIAYLASWVANIDKSDTVLEPSAGIGGLASFAKADGAKVYVNELSESRLNMLKELPFDGFFNENAEQINNILPDSVSPSVVLMNPPFSSTGGRTKNSTKNAIPHIEQALSRLQDGGRLVAIVGKGMADDTPTFRNWYNELRETYDIRANVGINGENYRKYGTTFDVQMLIIDKTGPQEGKTITGNYDDLREIPKLLEEVRNDRTKNSGNVEQNPEMIHDKAVEELDKAREAVTKAEEALDVARKMHEMYWFAENESVMNRGKKYSTLSRPFGKNTSTTRRDDVIRTLKKGGVPSEKLGEYRLQYADRTFSIVTKSEHEFAQYLSANKKSDESWDNALKRIQYHDGALEKAEKSYNDARSLEEQKRNAEEEAYEALTKYHNAQRKGEDVNDRNRKDQQLGTGADNKTDNGAVVSEARPETDLAGTVSANDSGRSNDKHVAEQSSSGQRPVRGGRESTDEKPGNVQKADAGTERNGRGVLDSAIQDNTEKPKNVSVSEPESGLGRNVSTERVGTDKRPSGGDNAGNPVSKKSKNKKASESDDGVYASYTTAPLTVKGAKKHPAPLVESSAMSAVSSPELHYVPKLDKKIIESGSLSDAQLENISYAGQSHEQVLPDGKRKGYFIGDGTGVGKGRQLAGIILDNFNQGRTKAVWVSAKKELFEDAIRDWSDLGSDPDKVFNYTNATTRKKLPDMNDGILFVTYDTLKGGSKDKGETKGTKHIDVIEKWLGDDFDGVIVFDESHKMANLKPTKKGFGKTKASEIAIAGNKLQNDMKNARVVYASATGATNIENLAYAQRLGLWGEGTQFADEEDFITKIGSSGIAAMELVARDMKAMGVYLARSISYDGVEYTQLQHKLTPDQKYMYNTMSEGWQVVLQNFDKAMQITGSAKSSQVKRARGQIYGSMQQFYNQVLSSMSMPSVISDIEKELAAGHSCVIQIVNTNEAAQDRAVSESKERGDTDLENLDITPRQLITGYVQNAFPVQQYENYIDEKGNEQSRPVVDSKGTPVLNKQAVAMREELLAKINDISIPEGPLDMLINHFGAENVAEITGRSSRVVNKAEKNGNIHKELESRNSAKANIAETKAFQDGEKRILVFSSAGGTGRSYHADKRAINQQKRIHYVLQPGWQASEAVQGFGRTHRSNQVDTPIFKLISTDVMGHKRFVTSIARRLDQLGALTKGQRQTGSGVFGEKDNLESPLSSEALRAFYKRLGTGSIPGVNSDSIFRKLGLYEKFHDEYGNFKLNDSVSTDIPMFLNRILALDVDSQNKVFEAFEEIRQSYYDAAIEAGTLDMGMENVKADKVEITNDSTVYTDPSTGAETRYIQAKVYNKPTVIKTLEDAKAYKPNFQGVVRMEDGSVRAVYRIADQTNAMGIVQKRYRLQGASGSIVNTMNAKNLEAKTEKVPEAEWKNVWKEAVKSVPEYDESELHMITGALLPIWNKLPTEGATKAMRITASDGTQYLGRIIPPKQIDAVLRNLGVKGSSVKKEYTGEDLYSAIMDKAQVAVFNGMYGGTLTVARRRVSGENRLEISGGNMFAVKSKFPGVFSETIQFKTRFFIPSGDRGKEILADMAKNYGVRSVGQADDDATVFFSKMQSTWGSRSGKDGKLPKMKSVSDLYKEAKSIFGVEINTGKIGSANAEGIYNTHANTIRTRVYGDLPTIAHELGHMFDKKYSLNEAAVVDKLVEHYRSDLEEAGYNESLFRNEAIAMYFADMLRNSETAQQENPEFSEYLFETLSNEDRNKLGDYKQMTAQYYAADDRTRRNAQIHYRHKDKSAVGKAKFQVGLFIRNPQSYMGNLSRNFARHWIDDVVDIGVAVGKENSRNVLNLTRRQRMADSIAAGRLKYAFTDNNGDVIGRSLQAVLSEGNINDKNAKDFEAYLVARVALDRLEASEDDKSVKTLVYADKSLGSKSALVDAIEEYERLNPTFHDAAEGVYEYKNNLLRIAVESGIIREELAERLKSTFPHYVPLYRVMERDKPSYSGRGKKTPHSPIARFKGSGRDIYSPIENLIVQTVNFTKAIQQNEARKALFDVIDKEEDMGIWAEKVPESKVFDIIPTAGVSDRIKAFLENDDMYTENLNEEQLGELYEDIMSYVGQYTGTWKRKQNQGDTVVSVMRNGLPQYYEIHDDGLMESLEALTPKQRSVVVNAFSVVTRTMSTLTTTVSPRFNLFTNPIRDAVNGFIFSKTTVNPVKYTADLVSAFFDALKESDDFKLYMARGGGYTGSVTSNMNAMRGVYQNLVPRTGFHPIAWASDFLPDVSNAIESAPRYAEYKRSLAKGESNVEAIQKANEITVDFKQGGSTTKYMNNFVMFFNAQITSIMQNFKRMKDKKTLAKWLATNLLTAASWAVLGKLIYDILGIDKKEADEAYTQMSPYNKFSNELLYIGDGQFIRIPKDTSTMILNTLIKAVWEKESLGNDNAFREMPGYLVDTFFPVWGAWDDISIFGTALDLARNETFTGAPIVPTAYQRQSPEMQYNEKTSAFSVRLGSLLNLSPMQIDYVIDDTGGYVGDLFLNLTKQGGPDWKSIFDVQKTSEKSILKGLPVPGVVLRDSVYSTDIVNVFYDTKDKYDKAASGYKSGGEKYTFYDTYGSYKYGKIADVYSKVNRQIKATADEVSKRELRAELNAVLNSVNNTEKTKLDERIAKLAEVTGYTVSDIAPYIVVPDEVTAKDANGEKVTYTLSGHNIIDYFNASQVILPQYCENILNGDASPEEKLEALKKLKREVKKYLDAQFVEYMNNQ